MQPNDVAQYLKDHPEFFEHYADLLADIFIPHPHGGHAISITERQILTLRERARLVEAKLTELLQFGEENDAIGEKVHRLCVSLLDTADRDQAVERFVYHLTEDFAVPHVAMQQWSRGSGYPASLAVSEDPRLQMEELTEPYCGPHVADEVLGWFGEAAGKLRSFALVRLGSAPDAGVLVLASEDPQRFYPEMGTLYLKRVGDLLAAALQRAVAAA